MPVIESFTVSVAKVISEPSKQAGTLEYFNFLLWGV